MTGEKDRFTTHEKMWKLDDKTLSTPAHDELVLNATPSFILSHLPDIFKEISDPTNWGWAFDTEKVTDRVAEIRACQKFENKYNRSPKTHSNYSNYNGKNYERISEDRVNPLDREQYKLDNEELLKMIQTEIDNSLLVAKDSQKYPDFLKTFDFSTVCECSYEVPITSRNQFIIGYWDIVLTLKKPILFKSDKFEYKINFGSIPQVIYIEAKPFIDSFGSVTRQIKTYIEYLKKPDYHTGYETNIVCLLTPDTRFKEAFESQGIRVIHP